MKLISKLSLFAWLSLLQVGFVDAEDFPVFPVPDFLNVKIVSESMVVNGLPMAAYEFSSNRSSQDVLDYYQSEWGASNTRYVDLGDWRILSHRDGDYLFTIQIEKNTETLTHGTLGITPAFRFLSKSRAKLKQQKKNVGKGFPTLPGTEILNDITALDQGRESRTVMFKNKRSMKSNLSYYENKMRADGWRNLLRNEGEQNRSINALAMNKSGQEFNLSVSKVQGETHGVAVYVR